MMKHHGGDSIARIPIFSGLGPKELEEVRSLFTEVNVPAGAVLIREGHLAEEFFIVESGTGRVERDGMFIADIGPGDYQGEISLLDGGPRTATVTATSPMQLLVATAAEFESLLHRMPTIARQMLPVLVARLRALS